MRRPEKFNDQEFLAMADSDEKKPAKTKAPKAKADEPTPAEAAAPAPEVMVMPPVYGVPLVGKVQVPPP